MARNYQKESAWERTAYQIFSFKARKDNGEAEQLKLVMGKGSFADCRCIFSGFFMSISHKTFSAVCKAGFRSRKKI